MLINSINSANVSFGKKNNQTRQGSYMIPMSIVGLAAGGITSQVKNIKINNDNLDDFIKDIEKNLPMYEENKSTFKSMKERVQKIIEEKISNLKLSSHDKEISIDEFLKKYVDAGQKDKNLTGLENDIKWVTNEANALKEQGKMELFAEKTAAVEEKLAIKKIILDSKDGKIDIKKLREYFLTVAERTPSIQADLKEMRHHIKKFNRQRFIFFSLIGFVGGAILGSFVKK